MRTYLLLGVSVSFEVVGATFMKYSDGFSNTMASLMVMGCYALAVTLYIIITRENEIGLINALWSGGGTLLVTLLGVFLFNESVTISKGIGLTIMITGMIGLTLPTKERRA